MNTQILTNDGAQSMASLPPRTGSAKYTQEQVEARMAEWNAAALKLPRPTNGAREVRDGIRFRGITLTNGQNGQQESHWELMTSNWNETGIMWPETLWLNSNSANPPLA